MKFVELTMPLNHQWMPDDVLPTSVKFFLGPKDHQEKGMVIGSDSGTCLTLPSVFEAFRKTARLDQVPLDKLVLRPTTVISIAKSEGEEIDQADVQKAFDAAQPEKGDAILIATGWGDKPYGESYLLGSPAFIFGSGDNIWRNECARTKAICCWSIRRWSDGRTST